MPSEREKHFHPRAVLSESRDLPARGQGTTLNEVVIWGGGKVGETPERWRAGEAGPGLRGGQVLQRSSVQREWLPPGGRGGRCPQATPEAGGQDGRMVWRPGRDASAASLCRFLSGLFGVRSLSDYVLFGGAGLMGTRPAGPRREPPAHTTRQNMSRPDRAREPADLMGRSCRGRSDGKRGTVCGGRGLAFTSAGSGDRFSSEVGTSRAEPNPGPNVASVGKRSQMQLKMGEFLWSKMGQGHQTGPKAI